MMLGRHLSLISGARQLSTRAAKIDALISGARQLSTRAAKIDGKAISAAVLATVRADVQALKARHGVVPGLAVVVVGERKDSLKYVAKKEALAASLGFTSIKRTLPVDARPEEVISVLNDLNADERCDGILLQLPLPGHISTEQMLSAISPAKDVDGFHPTNAGRLASWRTSTLAPCTPRGVIEMLRHAQVALEKSHVAIVGESNVVGLPLAVMLLAEKATVSIVHRHTLNPAEICSKADVVVSAAGVARLVKADWVRAGATVIDVGINFAPCPKTKKLKMCGDVDEAVWEKAAAVSPVPGGVGPMTVAMLMRNTVDACLMRLRWVELLEQQQQQQRAGETGGVGEADQSCVRWIDADGDGSVSVDELRAALGGAACDLSDAQLLELVALVDVDGDGRLSVEEVEDARALRRGGILPDAGDAK